MFVRWQEHSSGLRLKMMLHAQHCFLAFFAPQSAKTCRHDTRSVVDRSFFGDRAHATRVLLISFVTLAKLAVPLDRALFCSNLLVGLACNEKTFI